MQSTPTPCTVSNDAIERAARSTVLLVACDYDGVLAEFAIDPSAARLDRGALASLLRLADLPGTHAAIVSGRSKADLARIAGHPERLHLVGSHGAEMDGTSPPRCPGGLLDSLVSQVVEITSRWRGLVIERKPYGVAIHYRAAREADADAALWALLNGPARTPGVNVRPGSKVFELCTIDSDKGVAIATLRHRTGATGVIFIGDDVADDDALRALGVRDLGVRVGDALVHHPGLPVPRLPDVAATATLLARLVELRTEWAMGKHGTEMARPTSDRVDLDGPNGRRRPQRRLAVHF